MKLIVKNNAGERISIQIKSNETFMDLKERVEEEAGISLDLKDIALKGKRITETQRVMEYFLSYDAEDIPANIYCAVPGCKNTKQDNPDKVFFDFPADEIRCHQWVLYCQRHNVDPGKKRLSLTSESTICCDHFRADQFVKNTNTLLKRTAVPCVKMTPPRNPLPNFAIKPERPDNSKLYVYGSKGFLPQQSESAKEDLQHHVSLCRLCACTDTDCIMIFDEYGREMKIAEKINLCLPIKVRMTDALPKQICRDCFDRLNDLFDLADMCSLSQEKLAHINDLSSSTHDLALVSFDDSGEEEVILGPSSSDNYKGSSDSLDCCPLCNEGNMLPLDKKKNNSTQSSAVFDSLNDMDPLSLERSDLKNSSIDHSDYSFDGMYPESIEKKKGISSQIMYDNSDLESQAGCSSDDFTKETDPLKLDDNSKSDNDQISDCYSSLTSLNILSSEDSNQKTSRGHQLSPINEELTLESDIYNIDFDSENSNSSPVFEENSDRSKSPLFCRICASEFHSYKELLKHSFSHSFKGFYQCTACVNVFSTKGNLENHFNTHEEEEEIENVIYCDVCTKSFTSAISLASHLCTEDEVNINCTICKKQFRSEARLRQHMRTHAGARPSFCNICKKMFTDDIKLQKHNMYIHNKKKSHSCDECGKLFKSEASMRYHQRVHQSTDNVKPYACERCGKSFIRKSMLINHMSSSHKHVALETPCFTCKICFEAFPSTAAAVSHMDNHHKLECMDESTYSFEMHTINRLYMCEFCERCYVEGSVLNQHREQHPSEAPYECKYCETTYSTLEDVIHHRSGHEHEDLPSEYLSDFTIPRTYLCEFCERSFLNQVKYTEHLTVHYGPEPYQCRHCSVKFTTLLEAVDHRSNHEDSTPHADDYNFYRPYECHYCSKTFAIEDALIKHIRMHTGEKPFICDQCGKGFSQSSGLYTHQKVHSSERPYSCSVCPRTFKIKGDRDVHVRKHSGDRPYKCEFCGKAFMTQHVYSQHRKIHTGERPYKCDVCGIAFRRSHVLTVHKRIHTGEKPNICDICGKKYRQKGDMLKHRRVQHGITTTKPVNQLVSQLDGL